MEPKSPSQDSAVGFADDNIKHGPFPAYLDRGVDIQVIVSTLSGSQEALSFFNSKIRPVLDSNTSTEKYNLTLTESTHTIADLTRKIIFPNAKRGQPQTIILLSGDGGIHDIVNTMRHCLTSESLTHDSNFVRPTIGLIPMGTGNALAHSTGLGDPATALSKLFSGIARPLPSFTARLSPGAKLVTDEGRAREAVNPDGLTGADGEPTLYGCVVFSWGLHASLVATSDTAAYRKHGLQRFKMAAGELMKESHVYKGRVSILKSSPSGHTEWQVLHHPTSQLRGSSSKPLGTSKSEEEEEKKKEEDSHSYILATLVSNLESSFAISPNSTPLSCNLRLVAIGQQSAQELGRVLTLAYDGGKHVAEDAVTYEEIDGCRVEFAEPEEKWRTVCVDGKIVVVEEGGWVEVRNTKEEGRVVDLIC